MNRRWRKTADAWRMGMAAVLCLAAAAAGQDYVSPRVVPAAGREAVPATKASLAAAGPAAPAERVREGTRLVDEMGTFQPAGERVVFQPAGGKESYRVLENLALERIRTLDEGAGQRAWVISGIVTEYRGANFLLITKAVLQAAEGEGRVR